MKKLVSLIMAAALTCLAVSAFALECKQGKLCIDGISAVQAYIDDPDKCLGTKAAGTVFKVGTGGDVNVSDWVGILLIPTTDGQVAYNGSATKIRPIWAGQDNVVSIHPNTTQVVPNVEVIVCGM